MNKRTIIVGSAGQDGHILFDRLSREGRFVVGLDRDGVDCTETTDLPPVDILDAASVERLIERISPKEVYFLAAHHHSAEEKMAEARELIEKSFAIQVSAPVNFLEAIRRKSPGTRFFYASSCRVFGIPKTVPQDETTPFDPDCAYGISKAAGMRCLRYYRETHGLFAVSGILYNHESPLRQPKFVSQKIVQGAVAIRAGRQSKLTLGDLDATADWGYAPDFVDAMIRMLGMREAEDFVIATGQSHTVRELVEVAFGLLELDWRQHVEVAPALLSRRPRIFLGNAGRLAAATGWKPSVTFAEMMQILVRAEEQRSRSLFEAAD